MIFVTQVEKLLSRTLKIAVHKTIIFLVILCPRETRSLILSRINNSQLSSNKVLRKIFGRSLKVSD